MEIESLVEAHDRLQAENDELKALWKRATQFVMPGEFDTAESIIHYIQKLESQVIAIPWERKWVSKEDLLDQFPDKKQAINQLVDQAHEIK